MPVTMKNNDDFESALSPIFPVIADLYKAAEADVLASIPLLGPPRRVERAGRMHQAVRNQLRALCDREEIEPIMELIEEPDGQDLDYLVWRMGMTCAVRWGRFNKDRVRRNRTHRTQDCQKQMMMFPLMDVEIANMPLVSIIYDDEGDGYEAGIPLWWVKGLRLVREREDSIEQICAIAEFQQPKRRENRWKSPTTVIREREANVERWVHQLTRAG